MHIYNLSKYAIAAFTQTILLWFLLSSGVSAAGLLTPVNGQFPALDIRDHHVEVIVEDGYAMTTVEQVFHNPHGLDLEAVYSFPVPEKAAVSSFTVWIDGKPVHGEVLEKSRAREVYEQEKSAGRDVGLMEKDAYRTFDIRVSPVRASQDTRVRFGYIQPAHVDTGMGRYVYPLEEGGVDEQKLAFWTDNSKVSGSFSFNLLLRSAYPVDALRLPNHPQATVSQLGSGEWRVELSSGDAFPQQGDSMDSTQPTLQPNGFSLEQDLVVYWRHQAGLPGSVELLTYKPEGSERGTFMLTLTPGDDLQPINEGGDWIFVLDVSGSMQGKYATLVDGVQRALGRMRALDRFRIVVFNDTARELTAGYVTATPENIRHYSEALLQVSPGKGTNLYQGLTKGLGGIEADRTSAIVLVTDGVANVGESRQRKFLQLVEAKDIRLFTFVMGNSANRPLLEALTRASNGFSINVSNSDDIVGKILEAVSKVTHQALHGVRLEIDGVRTADLTPASIGSLYRGQQLIMFGHYWGEGMSEITLSGRISGNDKKYSSAIEFPRSNSLNPELERLWAFASIEDMMCEMRDFGENADLRQAVTDLSLEYGLVTDYTSMLVVREEVFESLGIERRNKTRLEVEARAKSQRAAQPVAQRRVDTGSPMFSGNRAGYQSSGGGSMNTGFVLVLIALSWLRARLSRENQA